MKFKLSEKMYRFYLKRRRGAKILSAVVAALGVLELWYFDAPAWMIAAFGLIFGLFNMVIIENAGNLLLAPAIQRMFHQGDAEPLLEISEELLSYPSSPAKRQIYQIDHCAALDHVGRYDEALALLTQVNIEEKTTPPSNKMVYYNNLAHLQFVLGTMDEATANYQKALAAYEAIKNDRMRKVNEPTARHIRAYLAYLEGEYRTCMALLQMPAPTLSGQVYQALLCAQALLALGDAEAAKEKLREVIGKGNKLYCVTEAKELLNTLEQKEILP